MIAWTTAREVAFQKVCSTSQSGTGVGNVNSGGPAGFGFSFGVTTAFTTGNTQNATGYTQSSSTFSSAFTAVEPSFSTNVYPGGETFQVSTAGWSIDLSGSNSFSTSGSFTTALQTTTTDSYIVGGFTTSSSVVDYSWKWTTQTNSENSTITEFVTTDAQGTSYFRENISLSKTRTVVTHTGTTIGNARDTIYMAEPNEVLWVINENPEWSKPLTDNAVSATQTTISDLREAIGVVTAASTAQTINSTESKSSYSFTQSSASFLEVTVNAKPASVNPQTTTQSLWISVAGASQSSQKRISGQPLVVYSGGTETVPASSATIATATQTDVLGGSWQNTFLVHSTVVNTVAIDNAVPSSCAGNTTKQKQLICGSSRIGSPPSMTIYSPAGVKLGNAVGLRFTGDGFSATDINESGPVTLSYLPIANDGELTKYTTASPIMPSWATVSSNSFTWLTTTINDGETVDTTFSGEFGINGATWKTIARSRADGLIGGDLAENETALIRVNRGLYKNQNGGTSFFEGNDTTYAGTKDTTYWYPISYLEPAFDRVVVAAPRNVSTWPV